MATCASPNLALNLVSREKEWRTAADIGLADCLSIAQSDGCGGWGRRGHAAALDTAGFSVLGTIALVTSTSVLSEPSATKVWMETALGGSADSARTVGNSRWRESRAGSFFGRHHHAHCASRHTWHAGRRSRLEVSLRRLGMVRCTQWRNLSSPQ